MPSPKKIRAMIERALPGVPDSEIGLVLDFVLKLRANPSLWAEPIKKILSKRNVVWDDYNSPKRKEKYRRPVPGPSR